MKLVRKGKVKEVYEVSDAELEFLFTDQISVFDKVIPSLVPRKGETLCRTSAHWFTIAEDLGVKTHFLRVLDGTRMRVRRVEVIADYTKLNPRTRNYLLPIEVIARYYVAGSLHDRIREGRILPGTLGFPKAHTPKYGDPLPQPFLETTTKLEKVDRELTADQAIRISGLTRDEYDALLETVLRLDERLNDQVRRRGLIHVDGKKEFAMDTERQLMLVDTFGTADEDRFWDLAAYERGEFLELSKEFVRQYYRKIGYHERLMAAREAGQLEPDIPPLPDNVLKEVSDLYVALFERLTDERFR